MIMILNITLILKWHIKTCWLIWHGYIISLCDLKQCLKAVDLYTCLCQINNWSSWIKYDTQQNFSNIINYLLCGLKIWTYGLTYCLIKIFWALCRIKYTWCVPIIARHYKKNHVQWEELNIVSKLTFMCLKFHLVY